MSLWIRSQDKSFLKDAKEFIIHTRSKNLKGDKCDYAISSQEYTGLVFGIYSTEEKALKVLDIMQDYITRNESNIYNSKFGVFQMPQDEEVNNGQKEN